MLPLTEIKIVSSDRDRVCRICHVKIARHTYAIVIQNVHVSPKIVDLHFHEGCFIRSYENAQLHRNNRI